MSALSMPEYPDFSVPRRNSSLPWWLIALSLLGCMWLIFTLKTVGLLLSLGIIGMLMVASRRRPDAVEIDALRASILLSAQDITDVLDEFDQFCTSPDAQHLEDRTLLRPALLERDSVNPDIAGFHEDCANAQRFLHRLPARINAPLSVSQAERLLAITDDRAASLRESWITARRVARGLPGS
ncbi:hypothetical protein HW450_01625 [Corynebacterium hindlerae]|uniref:Uncharacterized protein n=1 Tax=Corynebacterium hindlerae TaxID=699041 RepID=A0A7G5FFT6_9CORY|nr:hypothetical protein [Corynebacterium hindlerae]QMV85477.1 hypothetical protein HW450_01625 [Corynebacterium hindlerae]